MSEPDDAAEGFLRRWSRRKRAAAMRTAESRDNDAAAKPETGTHCSEPVPPKTEPSLDPTVLPPIDSITANSDIRPFMAPGVPLELSRAALRRAWLSDPDIRDFVGLAENQCDFTKPDSVPGFGALDLTPTMRRLIAQLVGGASDEATAPPASGAQDVNAAMENSPAAPATAESGATTGKSADQGGNDTSPLASSAEPEAPAYAAPQRDARALAADPVVSLRRHGRAIPK
jgi:hypothetical protein